MPSAFLHPSQTLCRQFLFRHKMARQFLFFPPFLLSQITILLTLIQMPPCSSSVDYYTSCADRFSCGNITDIGFPFWGGGRPDGCGHPDLFLSCNSNLTYITINNVKYRVLEAHPVDHILRIAREDYLNGLCPSQIQSTNLDPKLFEYGSDLKYNNLTLVYGCPVIVASVFPAHFRCPIKGVDNDFAYVQWGRIGPSQSCYKSVVVPIPSTFYSILFDIMDLNRIKAALGKGFEVEWIAGVEECEKCQQSKGVCGYDWNSNQTTCYCKDQSPDSVHKTCPYLQGPPDKKSSKAVVAGISAGVAAAVAILLGGCVYFMVQRRKKIAEQSKSTDLFMPPSSRGAVTSTTMSQSVPSYPSSKSDSVQRSFYFGVQVFTYAELEEATDNFDPSKELGDGGFGTVYYGKLKDGRVVAVKRHYESNFKRVEQFMNEVEILARIRHRNLVALYGCTSRHSRELLLVYEYIPNGTVADHIHGKRAKSGFLPWPIRLNIAVETAEALAYLHASDVVHRDVKSNNILLDNKYRVKVADFGLSRLFPNHVTHVSTAPQGTPGYVDPEYYQVYQLTDKSDVYSFGVVLVELISSLEAVDINRQRQDVNLANMAINKIQNHELHELVDPYLGFERDYAIRQMTTAVAELAFRCLQQERDMRPSMNEVLEILRTIQSEQYGGQEVEIMDIKADDITLLKNVPLPHSPDSVADKWVSSSTTSNSS